MTRLLHLTPLNAFRRTGYAGDNGVFYLLQDHLKSSSAVINQNGTLNSQNYYYPFGGNRGSAFSTLTTKRFTGQYHEADLPGGEGLSYYNARWYDAQLGRFISADVVVPGPANPQALNRYSYVFNNPRSLVDPSGRSPGSPGAGGGGGSLVLPSKSSAAVVVTCAGMGCSGGQKSGSVSRNPSITQWAGLFRGYYAAVLSNWGMPDFYYYGVESEVSTSGLLGFGAKGGGGAVPVLGFPK